MFAFRAIFALPFLLFTLAAPVANDAIVERGVISSDLTKFFASLQPDVDSISNLLKGGSNTNATIVTGLLTRVAIILNQIDINLSKGLANATLGTGTNVNLPLGGTTKGSTVTQTTTSLSNTINNINGVIKGLPSDVAKVPAVSSLVAQIAPLIASIVTKTNALLPGIETALNKVLNGSGLSKILGLNL